MILNGGVLDGKRYLSEAAVKRMTSKQTGDALKDEYGFGWAAGRTWCGHGGAYSTDMTIDRERNLILVWMVQHGGYPGDGRNSLAAFKKAAMETYSRPN